MKLKITNMQQHIQQLRKDKAGYKVHSVCLSSVRLSVVVVS